MVEVLASHAAVAFEKARLLAREREAAETASALLRLSQSLTGAHDPETVLARVAESVPEIVPCGFAATHLRDPADGSFRLIRALGLPEEGGARRQVPAAVGGSFLRSISEPFVLPREVVARVPRELWALDRPTAVAVAPLRFDPDGFAAIVLGAPEGSEDFEPRSLPLLRGIADIASLALGSARRFHELERFHELVESLDAVFWEADPTTLGFTFLSARAGDLLATGSRERWGEHIHPEDREEALAELHSAVGAGGDTASSTGPSAREAARCGCATSSTWLATREEPPSCVASWWTSPSASEPRRPSVAASGPTRRPSGGSGRRRSDSGPWMG